jgi:hypothetical protein
MNDHPVRAEGIDVTDVADGYVVYHPDRDRVHYLNHTAAVVFEFCTGENSAEDMIRLLQLAFDLPEPPEAEARACLRQLRDEGLIS